MACRYSGQIDLSRNPLLWGFPIVLEVLYVPHMRQDLIYDFIANFERFVDGFLLTLLKDAGAIFVRVLTRSGDPSGNLELLSGELSAVPKRYGQPYRCGIALYHFLRK